MLFCLQENYLATYGHFMMEVTGKGKACLPEGPTKAQDV